MSWLPVAKSFVLALASTVLLSLFGAAIPVAGLLLMPLAPQPVLTFGLRHGRIKAAGVLFLATAWITYLGGRELGLGYFLLALMVVLLFLSLGREWSIERVVASTAAGMLAALAAALFWLFGSLSEIQQGVRAALTENVDASLDLYDQIGFSSQGVALLRESAPQIIETVLKILPAIAFAGFVTVVLVNLFFLVRRFPERHSFLSAGADLKEWRAPEFLIWFFILAGFALFVPGAEAVKIWVLNVFLVIVLFYFFHGLSIVAYYFHHKHIPYFLRSLVYLLIVFEQLCTLLVVVLGLFDLWGDFRRLNKKDLSADRVS